MLHVGNSSKLGTPRGRRYERLLGKQRAQLEHFAKAPSHSFHNGMALRAPSTWELAFGELAQSIESLPVDGKPVTVFFDEAPWLDSRRSGFLDALEYFWNTRGARIARLKMFVCGSAADLTTLAGSIQARYQYDAFATSAPRPAAASTASPSPATRATTRPASITSRRVTTRRIRGHTKAWFHTDTRAMISRRSYKARILTTASASDHEEA